MSPRCDGGQGVTDHLNDMGDTQRFRDALLASAELQARLGVFEDPALFEAEARVIASELGLDPDQV